MNYHLCEIQGGHSYSSPAMIFWIISKAVGIGIGGIGKIPIPVVSVSVSVPLGIGKFFNRYHSGDKHLPGVTTLPYAVNGVHCQRRVMASQPMHNNLLIIIIRSIARHELTRAPVGLPCLRLILL